MQYAIQILPAYPLNHFGYPSLGTDGLEELKGLKEQAEEREEREERDGGETRLLLVPLKAFVCPLPPGGAGG